MTDDVAQRLFRPELHRFSVLARHLPPASPKARWLDLGGGAGEFSLLAVQRGYEVTLVDGDPGNIARTSSMGVHGVLGDLNAPLSDFQNDSFDGVSLIEVVEHVPMAEQLVREAFRVLRPGGVLLLSTPNPVWWRERLRILLGRTPEAEGYHYRFFTVAGTRALCEQAGFDIVHVEYSSPVFGLNWIVRRLLRRTKRRHVRVAAPFARFFARTIYVVGGKR